MGQIASHGEGVVEQNEGEAEYADVDAASGIVAGFQNCYHRENRRREILMRQSWTVRLGKQRS